MARWLNEHEIQESSKFQLVAKPKSKLDMLAGAGRGSEREREIERGHLKAPEVL